VSVGGRADHSDVRAARAVPSRSRLRAESGDSGVARRATDPRRASLRWCRTAILPGVNESVARIAALLQERNSIDTKIAKIIGRPVTAGHLGEWIASQIFDIRLEESAATQGFDGRFRSGALQGCTVNIKWYMKRTGLLDTTEFRGLDYYLVLTGPPSPAGSSRGISRPWCIQAVFLFEARQVRAGQAARRVRSGIASSVIRKYWDAAEIYPEARSPLLIATAEQVQMLRTFHPPPM
jgi:hypothetical protein